MEVHQHGHVHEKVKWKEYVFQFLMLFLAVFLGSLAENKREHGIENEKEKEYMRSLVTDLENDSSITNLYSSSIFEQVRKIDTLQDLLSSDPDKNSAQIKKCYDLSYFIRVYYTVFFNERISQLISSGNMRLIKTKGVADSILEYYNGIKNVEAQKELYTEYINKCLASMYNVFDISFLRTTIDSNGTLYYANTGQYSLLSTSPVELKKLTAILEVTKISAYLFSGKLKTINDQALRLIHYLKEKYKMNKP